ncbi:tonsoku-like protein [Coturnix japonica]|uniref:tonsoku-like protein n=1 Tax=Coturnix japonica TaxID=93934 RepID=UPI000776DD81|nr:tonsoku-like protein [Coturnix japonica]
MRSRLYLNLGLIYDSLNSARQRQRYLQLSVLLAERAGLWEDLYRAHYNMGHVHYRDGRYGAALRCWDKAKEAIKGHGDIGDMESDCLSSAAQVHLTLGDYRAAKRSYRAAYRLGSSDPKQRRLLRSNLRYATEMVRLQAALEAVGGIQDGGQDGGHDGGKDGGHDGSDGGHDGSQDGGKDGGHDGGHVEGDVGHDGGHIRRDGSHDGSHVGGDGSHDGGHVGGNSSHVGCDVGHDGGHVGGHDGSHVGRDVSHDVSHDVGHVGGDVSHDGGHVGGDVGHDGGHVGVDGGHVGGDVSHDGGHLGRDHSHDGGHIGGDGGHVGGDVGHHGGHVGGDISHDGGHVGCDGGHDGGHVGGDSGHVGGDGGHDGSHVVDPSLAMSLCEQLGDLCAKHGDYNRALTYYQQQLRYAEALSLPGRAVAAIHVSLGATCCDLRRHACAVRHFRSALRLQEGDAKEAADTWFSLALSLLDAGDPAGAEAAFNSAAQWAETAAQPQVKRRALRHLQALQKSHGADNGAGSGADNGASSEEEEEEEEEDEDEGGESSEVELSESGETL